MLCAKGFKVVSTLYFLACVGERSQSRIFTPYFSVRVRKDSKSYPHFTFLFVCEKTQSHIHTLLFSCCVRKNSKLNLCTLFFNNFTFWYLEKGLKVASLVYIHSPLVLIRSRLQLHISFHHVMVRDPLGSVQGPTSLFCFNRDGAWPFWLSPRSNITLLQSWRCVTLSAQSKVWPHYHQISVFFYFLQIPERNLCLYLYLIFTLIIWKLVKLK